MRITAALVRIILTSSPRVDEAESVGYDFLQYALKWSIWWIDSSSCSPGQNISIETIRSTLLFIVLEKNAIL